MLAHGLVGKRPLLLLLPLMSSVWQAHGLTQEYCSSENTGSSYDAVSDIYQSNGACHDQCVDDYAFAIVQYKQCWCSNYAPADSVDSSQCNQSCPGYPDDECGNEDDGLYGYIALTISPSGTQGAASSSTTSSSQSSSSSAAASTTTTEQSTSFSSSSSPSSVPSTSSSSVEQKPSTVYSSVSVTVTVKPSASVIVSYVTASSSSAAPSSTSSSSSSPSSTTSSSSTTSIAITSTKAAAATSSSPTSSSSLTHTTLVSTRVVTVSGAAVTETVTSTPLIGSGEKESDQHKGVSGGTIAGAVVGSLAGVALLLAGAFFLLRRRRSNATDPESSDASARRNQRRMERNTSVLSKTGLLSSSFAAADAEKFQDGGLSPGIAADGRRNSRPLVYDQRLNPAVLMQDWERNGSRASIGTLQDQRDYSRPLGVTNPDPADD